MQIKLPGFYVEGRYYGTRLHQAIARARLKADEYNRAIDVSHTQDGVTFERFRTVAPTVAPVKRYPLFSRSAARAVDNWLGAYVPERRS